MQYETATTLKDGLKAAHVDPDVLSTLLRGYKEPQRWSTAVEVSGRCPDWSYAQGGASRQHGPIMWSISVMDDRRIEERVRPCCIDQSHIIARN